MPGNLKLALLISAIDRVSGPVRKIGDRLEDTTRAAKRMEGRLAQVKGQAAAIKAYGKLDGKLEQTAARLRAAGVTSDLLAKQMKGAAKPSAELAAKLGKAKEATRELSAQQRRQVSGLVRLRDELREAKISIGELGSAEARLSREAGKLTRGLERQAKIGQRIGKMREGAKALAGRGMLVGGAAATAGAVAAALRRGVGSVMSPAMSYDQKIALLRSMPGIGAAKANAIGRRARAYTAKHAISLDDYIESAYRAISSGQTRRRMITAFAETSAATAKAARGSAPETDDLLTTLQRNFRTAKGAKGIRHVGDLVAAAQQGYQIANLGSLSESLNYAAPYAAANRVSLGQLIQVQGLLANAGRSGTMGGTATQGFLAQLPKAAQKLHFMTARNRQGGIDILGTLENIRAKYGDISKLRGRAQVRFDSAFGGIRGVELVNLLEPKIARERAQARGILGHSSGAAVRGQALVESGASDQLQIYRNNIANLKVAIGKTLLPGLVKLARIGERMAKWLTGLAKNHKTIVEIGGAVAVLAAGILTLGVPILAVTSSLMLAVAAKRMLNVKLLEGAKDAEKEAGKLGRLRRGLRALWRVSRAAGRGIASGARATARGISIAVIAVGSAIATMAKRVWAGLSIAGASLKGFVLANPMLVVLTGTLIALGVAIYEVVTRWRQLTGESHTSVTVSHGLEERLKEHTAFRLHFLRRAVAGDAFERRALEKVFGKSSGYQQIFDEADAKRRAQNVARLRTEAGLARPATVNQQMHLTVNGVTDPKAVAELIEERLHHAGAAARRGLLGDPVTL